MREGNLLGGGGGRRGGHACGFLFNIFSDAAIASENSPSLN